MSELETLTNELFRSFPAGLFQGNAVEHDCEECLEIRSALERRTWPLISAHFVDAHADSLPLLTREAFIAFLPAWLLRALQKPDGEVAGMLLVNLRGSTAATAFTPDQRSLVTRIVQWITANDGFGIVDPVNIDTREQVRTIWGDYAV
jgi:hypothetical protein